MNRFALCSILLCVDELMYSWQLAAVKHNLCSIMLVMLYATHNEFRSVLARAVSTSHQICLKIAAS